MPKLGDLLPKVGGKVTFNSPLILLLKDLNRSPLENEYFYLVGEKFIESCVIDKALFCDISIILCFN
jgi:hypothetical protein